MPLDDTDDVRYAKQRPAIPEPLRKNDAPIDKADSERFVTLGEVQSVVDSLVKTIGEGFATKDDVNNLFTAINGIKMAIGQSYPTREEAKEIARIAVPQTLRNLDNTGKRTGNVLLLSPGSARGLDASYWGSIAPSSVMPDGDEDNPNLIWNITKGEWEAGLVVPDGDEDNPHLVWNPVTEAWEADVIVPDGVSDTPHLVWNASTEIWEVGEIVPDGTEDSPNLVWDETNSKWDIDKIMPTGDVNNPHLVWNDSLGLWEKGAILPSGGDRWMVLQRNEDGDAVWDWVRWKL